MYQYESSWMANIRPSAVEQNNDPAVNDDSAFKSVTQHEVISDDNFIIIC